MEIIIVSRLSDASLGKSLDLGKLCGQREFQNKQSLTENLKRHEGDENNGALPSRKEKLIASAKAGVIRMALEGSNDMHD